MEDAPLPTPTPAYRCTGPRTSPPLWTPPPPELSSRPFPRGCKPTPANILRASPRLTLAGEVPDGFAVVPGKLDYWDNSQYGDCVTAEEAFAKACYSPEIFIDRSTVVAWASRHNVLNGATLVEVLDAMMSDGFQVGSQRYNNGSHGVVDYTKEVQLQLALTKGPVKIAIDSSALPNSAGRAQGWYSVGGRPGQFRNTDHCVSLSSFGTAAYLYEHLGVALPSAFKPDQRGYLLFTWSTLGFVDHAWLLSTCVEARLRQPTTIGVPPLPEPTPPTPPNPPFPPTPPDTGNLVAKGVLDFFGNSLPITITGNVGATVAAGTPAGWLQILDDVLTIYSAARRMDWAALAAAVEKLLADLGLTLTADETEQFVGAIMTRVQTRALGCNTPPASASEQA